MPSRPQSQLHAELSAGLAALDARLAAACAALPAGRFDTPRADGGWSAGRILEHLCVTNDGYLAVARDAVAAGGPPARGAWRPSLVGRLLVGAMERPARLRAPGAMQPGPTPRPDVRAALAATHAAFRALLDDAAGLDWARLRVRSPFVPLVRMNLGDAALLVLRHGERHAGQLERLVAEHRAG